MTRARREGRQQYGQSSGHSISCRQNSRNSSNKYLRDTCKHVLGNENVPKQLFSVDPSTSVVCRNQKGGLWEGWSSRGDRVGLKLEQERRVSDNQEEDETRRECTGCWAPEGGKDLRR